MFQLFITLNLRLWWHSLKKTEIGAILLSSVFFLLILGQFLGVAITLLFAGDVEAVRETYPWFTPDVQTALHLVFINLLWMSQLVFTKISRLRLHDNRKLLALGMPVRKLAFLINFAGILHPVNLLFSGFWLFYLGLMTSSAWQFLVIVLFIPVNYGIISTLKWRFKLFSSAHSKWMTGVWGISFFFLLILFSYLNLDSLSQNPQEIVRHLSWLHYTPGGLIYFLAAGPASPASLIAAAGMLFVSLVMLNRELIHQTKTALLTPAAAAAHPKNSLYLSFFKKWLGPAGGKYFHAVWSHSYAKSQLLLTFLIPFLYFSISHDGSSFGNYFVAAGLGFVPVMFFMTLLINPFGFENRELLLSLQSPVPVGTIIRERIHTAIKIGFVTILLVLIPIPWLYSSPAMMVQVALGIFFISLAVLYFVIRNCFQNYKKIEQVSLFSMSNPVLPASIIYTGMFILFLLGGFCFVPYRPYQWIQIIILVCLSAGLIFILHKKKEELVNLFKSNMIPKLWNEL